MRKILDYGRDLLAALQRQNAPTPSTPIAWRFGTISLALIIARLTRGLRLAAGLEARLLRAPPPRLTHRPPSSRPARPPRPQPPSQAQDDAALLRALPTAEEIADQIRHRPIGAVIVDICRDLGIDATHPLWPQIRDAIIKHDGSLTRMLTIWMGRRAGLHAPALPPTPSQPPLASPWQAWGGPRAASTAPS